MPTITAIRPLRRRDDRVAVHVDGAYWTSAPAAAVLELGLAAGLEVSTVRMEELALVFERGRAVHYAVDLLSRRDYAVAEVERRLVAKPFPPPVVVAALNRLTALGYLDDTRLARARAAAAPRAGWSRARVTDRLRRAGVAPDVVRDAVADCYPAALELDAARLAAARLDPEAVVTSPGRARAYRHLASRGFPAPVIAVVVGEVAARATAGSSSDRLPAPARAPEPDVVELTRLIRRRYPAAASDAGERRRATAFLARRSVPYAVITTVLAAAADG